jgi:nucleoside-diphosphate-sugar epimerase
MPNVPPGSRVLVTGANGYIALWVVQTLLENGYIARGVVRTAEKGKHLKEHFSSYGDKFELAIVPDITKEGAFDEAVKDVDAVEHTASPGQFHLVEPDDFIKPAVNGTVGVLQSALKYGNKVKRIVVTSSVAAIYHTPPTVGHVFDESSWADESIKLTAEKGRDADLMTKYRASKALAEKAAWEFVEKHKAEVKFDLVVLHPPFVIGPPIGALASPKDLNLSLAVFFFNVTLPNKTEEELKDTFNYVDVRDVSRAHVEALKTEKAAGQRIIVSEGETTWQETRNLLHSLRPDLYDSGALPRGFPKAEKVIKFKYNPDKGKKIFGFKFIPFDKTVKDTVADFEARGWVKKPTA